MYGIPNWESLSESQQKTIKNCNFLGYEECVRLRNKKGEHKLSILRCYDGGGFDIADPTGHVVYSDCDGDLCDIVQLLCKVLGTETINDPA